MLSFILRRWFQTFRMMSSSVTIMMRLCHLLNIFWEEKPETIMSLLETYLCVLVTKIQQIKHTHTHTPSSRFCCYCCFCFYDTIHVSTGAQPPLFIYCIRIGVASQSFIMQSVISRRFVHAFWQSYRIRTHWLLWIYICVYLLLNGPFKWLVTKVFELYTDIRNT